MRAERSGTDRPEAVELVSPLRNNEEDMTEVEGETSEDVTQKIAEDVNVGEELEAKEEGQKDNKRRKERRRSEEANKSEEEGDLSHEVAAEDAESFRCTPCEEGREAVGMKAPIKVSAKEKEEHERTHTPYRSWCSVCVRARGQKAPHIINT